jgi:hypothetical protein
MMSQVLWEIAIGMLTAGMSTRAVVRELNVSFSPISCLQCCFREFDIKSNHPHVAKICTQFLEAEKVALDRRVRQGVPVPANIHQLRTAIEEEWDNIPQATINSLINSIRRRCVMLHEENGGHIRY